MAKGTMLQGLWDEIPKDRQERIRGNAEKRIHAYRNLQQFRKNTGLTQAALSKKMAMPQGNLSRLEKTSDMLLSTLRDYVEAAGGKLHLSIELPNQETVLLSGLGDLVDHPGNISEERRPS